MTLQEEKTEASSSFNFGYEGGRIFGTEHTIEAVIRFAHSLGEQTATAAGYFHHHGTERSISTGLDSDQNFLVTEADQLLVPSHGDTSRARSRLESKPDGPDQLKKLDWCRVGRVQRIIIRPYQPFIASFTGGNRKCMT